jgi:hypothetical protein
LRTNRAWEALINAWQGAGGYEMVIGGDSAQELMGYPDFGLEVIPKN